VQQTNAIAFPSLLSMPQTKEVMVWCRWIARRFAGSRVIEIVRMSGAIGVQWQGIEQQFRSD
jgi:hypothetical protein